MQHMQKTSTWPTFEALLLAHKHCRRHKKPSASQLHFECRLGWSLLTLQRALANQKWTPSPYSSFVVLEPKPREIFAAHFGDRVVHHLVVAELEKWWAPRFSPHSFACQKDRGPYASLQYFQKHVRRISQGGRRNVYGTIPEPHTLKYQAPNSIKNLRRANVGTISRRAAVYPLAISQVNFLPMFYLPNLITL